jgi:hypothetical protein
MGVGLRFGAGPLRVYIPLTGGRRRRSVRTARRARVYRHGSCTIEHRSPETAARCPHGGPPLTPEQLAADRERRIFRWWIAGLVLAPYVVAVLPYTYWRVQSRTGRAVFLAWAVVALIVGASSNRR